MSRVSDNATVMFRDGLPSLRENWLSLSSKNKKILKGCLISLKLRLQFRLGRNGCHLEHVLQVVFIYGGNKCCRASLLF
jgi:hypothetical protein